MVHLVMFIFYLLKFNWNNTSDALHSSNYLVRSVLKAKLRFSSAEQHGLLLWRHSPVSYR